MLEEHVVAIAGVSVLASQEPAHKEHVHMVAVQPQYTAGQLIVEIRLEIRCPLDMSRGQRISAIFLSYIIIVCAVTPTSL